MSKNNQNHFNHKDLKINEEINEEIGRINKMSRFPKNSKNKNAENKRNPSGHKKKIYTQSRDHNDKKNNNNIQISQNSSISTDKNYPVNKKGSSNILRAKVIRNYDHVERVIIDLVNTDEGDSKTESMEGNNIYENDIYKRNIDKSSEYSENLNNKDNNICNSNSLNDISIAVNMIESRWKNNCALSKEVDIPIISNEITKKKRELEIVLNRWKEEQKIIKEDKLSIFNDNNIMNKWKKNVQIQKEINLDFPVDEKIIRDKEIYFINNRWKNILDKRNNENLSFLVDKIKIKEKEMNNIINRWLNNSQSLNIQNISFLVDKLEIEKKVKQNNINRWNINNKFMRFEDLSFPVDIAKMKKKENENIIKKWNNNNKCIKSENLLYLFDELQFKIKQYETRLKIWNKNNKLTNDINVSFLVNQEKKWINNIRKENKISLSYESVIDKDFFKYSEKQYINDLMKYIYFDKNNQNNLFIVNYGDNEDDLDKIKYKIIKPKNKNELELFLFNYFNENNNIIYKSDDLNKDNNQSQRSIYKETHINPTFILKDNQIKQLYEVFNKKEWKNDDLSISKQIDIKYEIIEPNFGKNVSLNKCEEIEQFELNGIKKIYEDFGETTPLSLLNDKFYIYAVSRNIKYSIQSPQKYISYLNNNSKNKMLSSYDKIKNINHFSLCIEKIDKLDTSKNSEFNETFNKK